MKPDEMMNLSGSLKNTGRMPVMFLGHGSPMNAIEENEFVIGWKEAAKSLPRPNALICVSAHWETRGTFVTAMEKPRTIHDFGGFPKELYQVQYPAPGNPDLAGEIKDMITKSETGLDKQWGLDHGCWSVIKHMYPEADIPVLQLSLDHNASPKYHYELAKQLAPLRNKGVLITGSGNLVHNLRMVAWDQLDSPGFSYDWATEANEKMKKFIMEDNHKALIDFRSQGTAFEIAINTAEHFLPLLYILALKEDDEEITFFNDKAVGGSLTMTSLKIE